MSEKTGGILLYVEDFRYEIQRRNRPKIFQINPKKVGIKLSPTEEI